MHMYVPLDSKFREALCKVNSKPFKVSGQLRLVLAWEFLISMATQSVENYFKWSMYTNAHQLRILQKSFRWYTSYINTASVSEGDH